MCTTSPAAYELAVKLCNDFDRRKQREKQLNVRKDADLQPARQPKEGAVSRTVTEIDYAKHEQTAKELERQEQEEHFARKKEEASQWCTLDHEHGPECRRVVGGCSRDHQREWNIYEKSTAEKIAAADRFRQEGNEVYKKQNYGLAAVHYRKALLQFDYTFPDTDEEETQMNDVKLACLLNLAACKCQREEWDEVLTQCRLALEINPRSVKAFYRSGLAHLARDQFDLARDALQSAIEVEPKNSEVRAAYEKLHKKMTDYKVRTKEVCKGMMAEGEEVLPEGQTSTMGSDATPSSGEMAAGEASKGNRLTGAEAVEEAQPDAKLRRRLVDSSQNRAQDTDVLHKREDDHDDDPLGLSPRVMHRLLKGAICLGLVSLLAACFVAVFDSVYSEQ